ncbi:ATP-dependent DNA helicase PIF1-like protein [Tanacetum coccineum]
MIVLAVASSGIASLLLPGGRTAHSRFVIPLELMENRTCGIKQNTYLAELMQQDIKAWKKETKYLEELRSCWDDTLGKFSQSYQKAKGQSQKKEEEDEESWIEIPEEFIIKSTKSPINEIMKQMFPDFAIRKSEDEYRKERAILTPRNDDVDAINAYMFKMLPDASVTYNSADKVCKASTDTLDQQHLYPIVFLNSLNFLGMPPHALSLKRNYP